MSATRTGQDGVTTFTERVARWKLGLVVAFVEGLINGLLIWTLAPETPLRATAVILIYNMSRAIKDYLSKNPINDVMKKSYPKAVLLFFLGVAMASLSGCATRDYQGADGSQFKSRTFMTWSKFDKASVGPNGLQISGATSKADTEAIAAATEAAVRGAVKGALPK